MEFAILETLNEIKRLIIEKNTDRWMSMREVVNYSGLSKSTVRRASRCGVLKTSRATGKLLFKVSSVDRWLNG